MYRYLFVLRKKQGLTLHNGILFGFWKLNMGEPDPPFLSNILNLFIYLFSYLFIFRKPKGCKKPVSHLILPISQRLYPR